MDDDGYDRFQGFGHEAISINYDHVLLPAYVGLGDAVPTDPIDYTSSEVDLIPLAPHAPIEILSDDDFDAAHGVTGGNGTLLESYRFAF